MRRRTAVLSTLSVTLALAGFSLADEIVLIPNSSVKAPGSRILGQITSETATEVKIKPPTGLEQTVPVDQIADVNYEGGGSPSYSLAQTRENSGQTTEAAELYKKAVSEATAKPLIATSAKFKRAMILTDVALAAPAKANEAIDELEAFSKSSPNSRQIGPALEALVRLYLIKDEPAKAEGPLGKLEKIPSMTDKVAVLRAQVLTKTGKFGEAISGLDAVIAKTKGTPQARDAKLAKAECLVAQKKYDDALATVKEVIKESPPEAAEIQALAHNTLGDCYRASGNKKDALEAYLKTEILFDKDKEQHARALAQIEQLFLDLKQDGRAAEVRDKLKQLYPQSPWTLGTQKGK